jgi:hypothetical protein
MDRETAVIRSEMSHTRAALGRKIDLLEAKARELSPRQLKRRYVSEYALDRALGGLLTLAGLKMTWSRWRAAGRRARVRAALESYGRTLQ